MKNTVNIILTRDPKDMLPSFNKVINNPTIDDVGYALHIDLIEYFKLNQIPFVVLDSKKVLLNPKVTLQKLCDFIGVLFNENMLSWQPQKRQEDGIWAKHWYGSVHESNSFMKYQPKSDAFPEHLKALLNDCQLYYNQLLKYAI